MSKGDRDKGGDVDVGGTGSERRCRGLEPHAVLLATVRCAFVDTVVMLFGIKQAPAPK